MNRNVAEDILGVLVLISGGLLFSLWFFSLPPEGQKQFVDRVFGLFTLILAQPGVFATAKIASNSQLPLRKRILGSVLVFSFLAFALPMGVSTWLSTIIVMP